MEQLHAGSGRLGHNMDYGAIWAWLGNYCHAHPLDSLFLVGQELSKDLLARMRETN